MGGRGPAGVSFFIILSGFVLSLGYFEKIKKREFDLKKFMLKRVIRVYPLHLLTLLVFIAFFCIKFNLKEWISLLPNSMLLQSWLPLKSIYFSGNGVSWCLCDLLFFYAIFPFIGRMIDRNVNKSTIYFLCIICVYLVCVYFIPTGRVRYFVYICPLTRLIDFSIGVFLYVWCQKFSKTRVQKKLDLLSFKRKTLLEILAIIPIIIALTLYNKILPQYSYGSLFWLPIIILIIVLLVTKSGGVNVCLSNKYLVKFGEFSFTIYMIHQLFMKISDLLLKYFDFYLHQGLRFILYFVLVIFISYFVFKYIETPISNKLKHYIK